MGFGGSRARLENDLGGRESEREALRTRDRWACYSLVLDGAAAGIGSTARSATPHAPSPVTSQRSGSKAPPSVRPDHVFARALVVRRADRAVAGHVAALAGVAGREAVAVGLDKVSDEGTIVGDPPPCRFPSAASRRRPGRRRCPRSSGFVPSARLGDVREPVVVVVGIDAVRRSPSRSVSSPTRRSASTAWRTEAAPGSVRRLRRSGDPRLRHLERRVEQPRARQR